MNEKKLLALYGLKWNPFSKDVPSEALYSTTQIEHFCWRVENMLTDGGFAMLTGESGLGKSVALRQISEKLLKLRDVTVCEFSRPQSSIVDFYRELGFLFGIELNANNRWGGFKALREKWKTHIDSTLYRPVLLIDEAQEMPSCVLSEIRLLSSLSFDSKTIITVVLAGDSRLPQKLKTQELIPLGTRLAVRLNLEPWSKETLATLLGESIDCAGAPNLMTKELVQILAEHAMGSPRILFNMACELLMSAAKQEAMQLDEKLFLETFVTHKPNTKKRMVA